jgi:hypothetical protein
MRQWLLQFYGSTEEMPSKFVLEATPYSLTTLLAEFGNRETDLLGLIDTTAVIVTKRGTKHSILEVLQHFTGGKEGKSEFFVHYAKEKRVGKKIGSESFTAIVQQTIEMLEELLSSDTLKVEEVDHVRRLSEQLNKPFSAEIALLNQFYRQNAVLDLSNTIVIADHILYFAENQAIIANLFHTYFQGHDEVLANAIRAIDVQIANMTVREAREKLESRIYPLLGDQVLFAKPPFIEVLTNKHVLIKYLHVASPTFARTTSLLNINSLGRENV